MPPLQRLKKEIPILSSYSVRYIYCAELLPIMKFGRFVSLLFLKQLRGIGVIGVVGQGKGRRKPYVLDGA
jgi:hypothetical protein